MNIDYKNNNIIIGGISSVNGNDIILQLTTYGFRKNGSEDYWLANSNRPAELILNLMDYLSIKGHDYSISHSASTVINYHQNNRIALDNMREKGQTIKNGEIDASLLNEFKSFLSTLPRTLYDHQEKAALHLFALGNGANFSIPGAGKTSVTLSVYEKNKLDGKVNTLFVVGPTACYYTWKEEFKSTLGREPDSIILSGKTSEQRKKYYTLPTTHSPELLLVSFNTLLNDVDMICKMFASHGKDVFFVIDEAHYIKRLDASWANAVLRISPYAKNRCVLTGTPMPHSYKDLYNIFDVLWPENSPINRQSRVSIENHMANQNNDAVINILDETIAPLFYRVRKKDLGLGPQKFHEPIKIHMNTIEKQIYDTIVKEVRHFSRENYIKEASMRDRLRKARIMRLRQATSYPKLLETAIVDIDENFDISQSDAARNIQNYDTLEKPAKLEKLLEIVQDFKENNQKLVIWTNFIGTLHLIESELEKIGIKAKSIYGEVPIESDDGLLTREHIRKLFIDPTSGVDFLIANPAACAESISLHKTCHNAVYYDMSFNCAQYLQSLDRIHRVGGSENVSVNYYFLHYENNFEQTIMDNLMTKSENMRALIEQDYPIYSMDMLDDELDIDIYNQVFGQD